MKRIFSRVKYQDKRAKARLKNFYDRVHKADLGEYREQDTAKLKETLKASRTASQAYREDWRLGPLAPRRDVGDKADVFGSVNNNVAGNGMPKPMRRELENKGEQHPNELKDWHIRQGDRVLVTSGVDKGQIGVVGIVHKDSETANVEGMNMYYVEVMEWQKVDGDPAPTRQHEHPLPIKDLRLVAGIADPQTGLVRDYIIPESNIEVGDIWLPNETTGEMEKTYTRVIRGTQIEIPLPTEEEKEEESENHVDDTSVMDLQRRTWTPELLKPPMPVEVLDELRNPFSKYRKRHEDWYVKRAEERERREELATNPQKNRLDTPIMTAGAKAVRKKRMEPGWGGRKKVEVLEEIGRFMAEKNGTARQASATQ